MASSYSRLIGWAQAGPMCSLKRRGWPQLLWRPASFASVVAQPIVIHLNREAPWDMLCSGLPDWTDRPVGCRCCCWIGLSSWCGVRRDLKPTLSRLEGKERKRARSRPLFYNWLPVNCASGECYAQAARSLQLALKRTAR